MKRMKKEVLINAMDELLAEYNEYAHGGNSEILSANLDGNNDVTFEFYDGVKTMSLLEALSYLALEVAALHSEIGE